MICALMHLSLHLKITDVYLVQKSKIIGHIGNTLSLTMKHINEIQYHIKIIVELFPGLFKDRVL